MIKYREDIGEIDKSFRFVGIPRCDTCWENSSISWMKNSIRNYHPTFIDESWYDDEEERTFIAEQNITGIDYILDWYEYQIDYISPSPYIITIPEELSTSIEDSCILIKKELIKSFELFWIDKNSCANKIRITIELLLDFLWIPKKGKIKCSECKRDEEGLLSLERRIMKSSDKISTEMLLAIKLVWNHWSHWSKKILQEDLVKTYQILQFCLDEIFSKKVMRIEDNIDYLNKRFHD
jgi:hypothetical protein